MPRYDFQCQKCGKIIEIGMSISAFTSQKDSLLCDDECAGQLKSIITSAPKFELKGVGWSNNDYGITENETRKNLEDSRKLEDRFHDGQSKFKE